VKDQSELIQSLNDEISIGNFNFDSLTTVNEEATKEIGELNEKYESAIKNLRLSEALL
jgi:septation ring formation regulator EzrA